MIRGGRSWSNKGPLSGLRSICPCLVATVADALVLRHHLEHAQRLEWSVHHELVRQPGRYAAARLAAHFVGDFGEPGALGDHLPGAGDAGHADAVLHRRDVVRCGLQVADHAAVRGFLGADLQHQVARCGGPGELGVEVDPDGFVAVLEQAHLCAGVEPGAGDAQVLLQVAEGGDIGLHQCHAAEALVARTGYFAQVDLDAVLVLGELPVRGLRMGERRGCQQQGEQQRGRAFHDGEPAEE